MRARSLMPVAALVLGGCLAEESRDESFDWHEHAPLPGAELYDPPPAHCAAVTSTLEIVDTFGVGETAFTQGETVNLRLLVRNDSADEVMLTNPDACPQVHFEIVDAQNRIVEHSNDGFACTAAQQTLVYAPGEATLFAFDWDQRRRDAQQAPVGTYTVYAVERTKCRFALTRSAQITIN